MPKNADYCGDCLQKNYLFDHIHALGDYEKPLSILIKQLKYQQKLIAGELLAELLVKSILSRYSAQEMQLFDYLLAVPLHHKKLQKRGFNQAKIISDKLHKQLKIPRIDGYIKRKTETTPQEGLSITQRSKNVKSAFTTSATMQPSIKGKNIILLDDVVTTGATVNSVSKILVEQGAKSITIFCICRTALR